MCGRYSLVAKAEELASRFNVDVPPFYKPHYNAAPSQLLPVITDESPGGLSVFYWGISPEWSKNRVISERIINLQSENLLEKPVYRKALRSQRCLVPADGFYEWKKVGKKTSIPYRFIRKDKKIFSFAGLWEEYEDVNGSAFHTFSILTTAPNALVSPIHERMPVILGKDSEKTWLSKTSSENELMKILQPLPAEELDVYTVSHRVNTVNNNDPSLVLPSPPVDQHGNLTLFG